ncbi:S1C family serine protease [Candidatus Parcubacteria bacterium]|nr:S1C family serine protease [Candidatus Parcubacteria bacterium]
MDIEQLTKMQIILLTLLVSFVTSIATGIVTITLMDQAPPAITQTIHKVVEKTVENVIPNNQTAIVKNEVVIVKEQNLIADAIEKNSKNIAKIYKKTEKGEDFVGFGIVVDKSGIIATDPSIIVDGEIYSASIGDKKVSLKVFPFDKNSRILYLKAVDSEEGIFKSIFKAPVFIGSESLRLGQSVIAIRGGKSIEVTTGIVSGFAEEDIKAEPVVETTGKIENTTSAVKIEEKVKEEIKTIVWGVKTNIPADDIIPGAPLLNLNGDIIGISALPKSNTFTFINISKEDIKKLLDSESVTAVVK